MKSPKLKLVLAVLVLALLPALVQAQGAVPLTVSYQGRVTVGGEPFDGLGYFKFAVMQSDDYMEWSNDGTHGLSPEPYVPVELGVSNGLFSVLLGDLSVTGMTQPLPHHAFVDPGSTLRVWFSADGTTYTRLPDRPISSVPYAFYAEDAATLSGKTYLDFAWADHHHWGQTWSGSGSGLTLNSSGGGPGFVVSSGDNDGIYVPAAGGDGVDVHNAGEDGLKVATATDDGVQIGFQTWGGDYVGAGDDGVAIYDAGNASSHTLPANEGYGDTHDGVDIAGAAGFGVWVGYAGRDGLHVEDAASTGVRVGSASVGVEIGQTVAEGIFVSTTGGNAIMVEDAGVDGLAINLAADDGIEIYDVGDAPVHTLPIDVGVGDTHDGIDIAGVRDYGLWVGYAGASGVNVDAAADDGVSVGTVGRHGVFVWDAGSYGVYVQRAENDGVQVWEASDDGIRVWNAGLDGVFANTTAESAEWGFATPDKVTAANVSMQSLSIIGRNDGPVALQPGDLVAVAGVDRPLLGRNTPMPNVRRADGGLAGVIGVVESRMKLTVVDPIAERKERGEATGDVRQEDVIHEEARSVAGPAAPGDYVSIVVLGITDVKVDATAQAIEAGQRLTAADLAGHARALQTRVLEGMTVTEGSPVLGIALESLEKGTGTIPVFVTLQ